jgi:hypothetical protein
MANLVAPLALILSRQSLVFEPIDPTPDRADAAGIHLAPSPINASWAEGIEDAEIFALP